MKINAKEAFGLLKQSFRDFSDDECPRLAAALSYYTVFALPPLLILILMIVGAVFDPADVREALTGQIGSMIGSEAKAQIATIITHAENPGAKRGIGAVLGIGALLFGATGAFLQLQGALNRAWEVEPDKSQGGIKNFVFKRLLSLGMILGVAFLLLVSLVLSTVISALSGVLEQAFPWFSGAVSFVIENLFTLAVVTLLFGAIFKILPDARIAWRDVWVGAFVTGLLFVIGKGLLGLYLGRSDPGKAFGAAGSLVLILVWIYYSSMIVLFGAEFTQTWAVEKGGGIEPEEGAKRMTDEVPGLGPDSGPGGKSGTSGEPDAVTAAEAARERATKRAS
ncbi:MAG TPA: YihY/virulence factor BrkB family protein [Longimicrobium sp.]|jgi:membrane protein